MRKSFLPSAKILVILCISAVCMMANHVIASHSAGAEITYRCLGGNNYEFTVRFYRDCRGIAAGTTQLITFTSSCGTMPAVTLPRVSVKNVGPSCGSGAFCVEEHVYRGTVTMTTPCVDWKVGAGVCCRNAAINTINNPSAQNIYVEAMLNTVDAPCGSSPTFGNNIPAVFACVNNRVCWSSQASDPNGDAVSYQLITPMITTAGTVSYRPGYAHNNPVVSTQGSMAFVNGRFCFTPPSQQVAIVAVKITQTKGGKVVGYTTRDAQIQILTCNNLEPANDGINSNGSFVKTICPNSNFCFTTKGTDPNAGDNVKISAQNLPAGATFTSSGGSRPTGTFCWKPTANQVRTQPYRFQVLVEDDACPVPAEKWFDYEITVSPVHTADAGPDKDLTCNQNTTRVTSTIGGNWQGNGPYTWTWTNGNQTKTGQAVNVGAGTWTLTITSTSSGCTATDQVVVTKPPAINANAGPDKNVPCTPGATASLRGNSNGGSGGVSYRWQDNNGNTWNTRTIDAGVGQYTLTVTDNKGCTDVDVVNVNADAAPTATFSNGSPCEGNRSNFADKTVEVNGDPIVSWDWDFGDPGSGSANAATTQNTNHTYPDSGWYDVTMTVTTQAGCVSTFNKQVRVRPNPIASITSTGAGCGGQNGLGEAEVQASLGSTPYTYDWSNGQTTAQATGLAVGNYTVTVTDKYGCEVQESVDINPGLGGSLPNEDVTCRGGSDGSAEALPTGGDGNYTYTWKDDQGNTIGSNSTIDNLDAGTYSVTVVDGQGCSISANFNITEPDAIAGGIRKENVLCSGDATGSVAPFVTAGGNEPFTFNYSWGPTVTGINVGDSTQRMNDIPAGQHSIEIVDSKGCTITVPFTIEEPPTPVAVTITDKQDALCVGGGGEATALATGGVEVFNYSWDDGSGQTTSKATGLGAGTYTVTVTDTNGCTASESVVIEALGNLDATISESTQNGCDRSGGNNGQAKVTVDGDSEPYTYAWDDEAQQTTEIAFGLKGGTYTVLVTDANGCTATATVVIEDKIKISKVVTQTTCTGCNDGTAAVTKVEGTGTPPFTYRWQDINGNTLGTDSVITGLAPGTYTVTVTDNSTPVQCFRVDTIFVSVVNSIDDILSQSQVSIYPNPGKDIFNVQFSGLAVEDVQLSVHTIRGEAILIRSLEGLNDGAPIKLDLEGYESGVYLLQVRSKNLNLARRLIISH